MLANIRVDQDLKNAKEEYERSLQASRQSDSVALIGHPFVTVGDNDRFRHFLNTDHDSVQSNP